jgi:hypothetical protein
VAATACGSVPKIVYFGEMGRVVLLVNQHDSPEALTLFGWGSFHFLPSRTVLYYYYYYYYYY